MRTAKTIAFSENVLKDICRIVLDSPSGRETGVCLFGVSVGSCDVVLSIAGPGPRALHESVLYSPDAEFTNALFDAVRTALPSIRWLGELHLHPAGMPWLSGTDFRMIRKILLSHDPHTIKPHEIVAGIMQRRDGTVEIHTFHCTRTCLEGTVMPIRRADSAVLSEARRLAAQEPEEFPEELKRGVAQARTGFPRRFIMAVLFQAGRLIEMLSRKIRRKK